MTELEKLGAAAKSASIILAQADSAVKNRALEAAAQALLDGTGAILSANALDMQAAESAGARSALLDRLRLTEGRIEAMAAAVRQIAAQEDPIGLIDSTVSRPNGLTICRRRVPLGVVGIIYEARPNVTADAAALCLKSGNACILRGGSEAINSNRALRDLICPALESAGLPAGSVGLVEDVDRRSAKELMHLSDYLDVLIPRGGPGLIRAVADEAAVPVIRTGEGVCHIYVDAAADLDMAARILQNAKCSRPSVCNAAECVLVHRDVAEDFWRAALPLLEEVELRCDLATLEILGERAVPAMDSDWDAEYGDYILAVRMVDSLSEAIGFISAHSTGHSECIITDSRRAADEFLNRVDAAAVYVNASTRFTDGGEFGLGAEIGISTQKLHARGPMGLMALTSWKYVVYGDGQIR